MNLPPMIKRIPIHPARAYGAALAMAMIALLLSPSVLNKIEDGLYARVIQPLRVALDATYSLSPEIQVVTTDSDDDATSNSPTRVLLELGAREIYVIPALVQPYHLSAMGEVTRARVPTGRLPLIGGNDLAYLGTVNTGLESHPLGMQLPDETFVTGPGSILRPLTIDPSHFSAGFQSVNDLLRAGQVQGRIIVLVSSLAAPNSPEIRSLVSTINSRFTGHWPQAVHVGASGWWALTILCLIFSCLASARGVFIFLVSIGSPILFTGLILEVRFGICVNWIPLALSSTLIPSCTLLGSALARRWRARRIEQLFRRDEDETFRIDDIDVQEFQGEKKVAILFVDIIGFSATIERAAPQRIVDSLERRLERVTRAVHKHGGFVSRDLGDGLLCIFGFGKGGTYSPIENAVACATELQTETLENANSLVHEDDCLPLRVGVNLSSVYYGELTGVGPTFVGHGITFAFRLQSVCEPYRIMLSQEAWSELLLHTRQMHQTRQKLVRVEHFKETFEAIEIDPFPDDAARLSKALTAFNRFRGVSRAELRWDLPEGLKVVVHTPHGGGNLINYSKNGFLLELNTYLAQGFRCQFEITLPATYVKSRENVRTLEGEVRWSRPVGNERFMHGILLHATQSHVLEDLLIDLHLSCGRVELINLMKLKAHEAA